MVRRKRTYSPEDPRDPSNSTDALCRAVKRLHTASPATSSFTSASEQGAQAEPEVSSGIANATARLSIHKFAPHTDPIKSAQQTPTSPEAACTSQERPLIPKPLGRSSISKAQEAGGCEPRSQPHSLSARALAAARQRDEADSSGELPSKSVTTEGAPAAGSKIEKGAGSSDAQGNAALQRQQPGSEGPRGAAVGSVVDGRLQQDLQNIQRGLAGIAVNRQVAGENDSDEEEGVAQPSTPLRRENLSPMAVKGHNVGTRGSEQQDAAYAKLYEETNMLLKNLHFARLQRTTGS